jgi:glucose-1-phosphate cytidylyltransferase
MKVVIFCGGLGVRMGEATRSIPKPMIPVGDRPILWHIMRYYAAFGYDDFILCLGYRAEIVRAYFADADNGSGWRVTFADTGLHATIADRLRAIEPLLGDDPVFLATYGDGLTDAPVDDLVASFERHGKTVQFLSVRPTSTFHVVEADASGHVTNIEDVAKSGLRINGGYFVMTPRIFDWIEPGEELVDEPFRRLIAANELVAYRYDGFWEPMDTLKDRHRLEALWRSGDAPWLRDRPPPDRTPEAAPALR